MSNWLDGTEWILGMNIGLEKDSGAPIGGKTGILG